MNRQRRWSMVGINTSKKIKEIMESPHLPVLVQNMTSRSISDLVNRVGVENSHAIVLHASNEQIKGMLDIQLWQNKPGKMDLLQIDSFFPWLQIWNDLGAEFVSEKLVSLGAEFVAVCFEKHLTAYNTEVVGLAASGESFGRFDVIPANGIDEIEDELIWFVLLDTLRHLHIHAAEFLDTVLERCSFVRSILREDIAEHHLPEDMQRDLGQERDERAEETGYISATDAFAFLSISDTGTFEEVMLNVQYDDLTRRYFRIQNTQPDAKSRDIDTPDPGEGVMGVESAFTHSQTPGVQVQTSETSQEDLLQLNGILVELGIGPRRESPQLLPPAEEKSYQSLTHLLDQAMHSLQRDSEELFEKRRDEILYLSNILIAGTGVHGAQFTETNAVRAVRSTCNLGLDYLVHHQNADPEELYYSFLSAEPGALLPFQIGYKLLNQVPENCAAALRSFLSSKRTTSRLKRVPWIAAQLDHILPGDSLVEKVTAGKFEELKRDIDLLSLVLDHTAVHAMDYLIDPFPVLPKIISMNPQPIRLDRSIRFISGLGDLEIIQDYVDNLLLDI